MRAEPNCSNLCTNFAEINHDLFADLVACLLRWRRLVSAANSVNNRESPPPLYPPEPPDLPPTHPPNHLHLFRAGLFLFINQSYLDYFASEPRNVIGQNGRYWGQIDRVVENSLEYNLVQFAWIYFCSHHPTMLRQAWLLQEARVCVLKNEEKRKGGEGRKRVGRKKEMKKARKERKLVEEGRNKEECPPAEEDGMERFACPTPDHMGRYRCIDDHVLCDGFIDCPSGEDEDRQACMFYKTTKAHLDILADALLRWARGR
ncbi:hypothetical protein LSTR_LSTR004093 [Laodelphax striatellus]|uniref:Uncharacterized protein n=1 Tax=Laodelphax striatellus TaxID=195883 RepID=A0A482WGK6_LAOST|nr:hypothetical protein LSTR_LSTR004093 [Laodelphax striatellus]